MSLLVHVQKLSMQSTVSLLFMHPADAHLRCGFDTVHDRPGVRSLIWATSALSVDSSALISISNANTASLCAIVPGTPAGAVQRCSGW